MNQPEVCIGLVPCKRDFLSKAAAATKSLHSCLTLGDPMDGSPPGSSVHGTFQARVLEWGAIAFSLNKVKFSQFADFLTDWDNELTAGRGEGTVQECGMRMHTAIFKMDDQRWPTIQHREPSLMLCDSLDGRRTWEELIHVYVWLSPFAVHPKLSQHCLLIGYTSIQI